jgi:hypothetical protein
MIETMLFLGGMWGGSIVTALAIALVSMARRSDDADEIARVKLKLQGSADLNRALTEQNQRLHDELFELNALRRDGSSAVKRSLQ